MPYPKYKTQLTESLDKVTTEVENMWQMPTYRCYSDFTNTRENYFIVHWLLNEEQKKMGLPTKSKQNETRSTLLPVGRQYQEKHRPRGAIPKAAAVAGAVRLFRTGNMFGA